MRKISEGDALRRMDVPLPDKYKSHRSLVALYHDYTWH